MTKKPKKVVKKKQVVVENIHSINNQEFRYPSLISRLLNWFKYKEPSRPFYNSQGDL